VYFVLIENINILNPVTKSDECTEAHAWPLLWTLNLTSYNDYSNCLFPQMRTQVGVIINGSFLVYLFFLNFKPECSNKKKTSLKIIHILIIRIARIYFFRWGLGTKTFLSCFQKLFESKSTRNGMQLKIIYLIEQFFVKFRFLVSFFPDISNAAVFGYIYTLTTSTSTFTWTSF
jgi:hypothetical protein